MDLLTCDVKKTYLKFFFAAFGSALIASIYALVDMAMVGQYYGPIGTSAIAIVSPIWNIIYSLGLLIGIGASILYSVCKGEKKDNPNIYFSSAIVYGIIVSILLYIVIWLKEDSLLKFFGGTDETIPLAKKYMLPIKYSVPLFVFAQILSSFLRNDNAPRLATIGVVIGGVFNIFGDYLLVFTFDLGITGAGIATCLCSFVSLIVMSTHFLNKNNSLMIFINGEVFKPIFKIFINGFPSFIIDLSMGILTIIYNRQIIKYFDNDVLSIYGIIINISTLVQCCSYGIGEASQPLVSQNFGAKKYDRINKVLKYLIVTSFIVGGVWVAISLAMPNVLVRIFMKPTDRVLMLAPKIIRLYSISFILLPLNVASMFYFQSILKSKISLIISLARGVFISGILLLVLPLINKELIWITMVLTETIVSIFVFLILFISEKQFKKQIDKEALL
ncbi:MAG: MATE family efflux transporter [Bacilli bacterium]|nr:MATE family efflux transporter [Bacilli bacterium]